MPVTVNFVPLVSEPAGVVTEIFPVVAPGGTVAVIFVSELTVNVAVVPLNFTAVAPENPVPLIVTEVPTGPLFGEKDVIVGPAALVTVNCVVLVAKPLGVTTLIRPVVAPAGTTAVILTSESTVNVAGVPANFTLVAPVNPDPLIVTEVPTGPLVGENDEIAGTAAHEAGATAMVAATSVATTALLRSVGVRATDMARLLVTGGQPATESWHTPTIVATVYAVGRVGARDPRLPSLAYPASGGGPDPPGGAHRDAARDGTALGGRKRGEVEHGVSELARLPVCLIGERLDVAN